MLALIYTMVISNYAYAEPQDFRPEKDIEMSIVDSMDDSTAAYVIVGSCKVKINKDALKHAPDLVVEIVTKKCLY